MTGERQLAIMREVHFGVGDTGAVCLWFSAYVTESTAALQVLDVERAVELIEAYGVKDVAALEGKPCWVNADANRISYAGPWKR